MASAVRHPWRVSPREAIAIQHRLRPKLILDRAPPEVRVVAGIDVSYTRGSNRLYGAIVLLDLTAPPTKAQPAFPLLESAVAAMTVDFPYIPGLLSFREIPVVLKAWATLRRRPDCLICDGQGIAHPRRMGLAAHLGLLLDLPAIGCGKRRLIGRYDPPGPERGDIVPLIDGDETIGAVLRTRPGVKPLFVSQGHRMTLARAVEILLTTQVRYRLPEPIRAAHRLVNAVRREEDAARGGGAAVR